MQHKKYLIYLRKNRNYGICYLRYLMVKYIEHLHFTKLNTARDLDNNSLFSVTIRLPPITFLFNYCSDTHISKLIRFNSKFMPVSTVLFFLLFHALNIRTLLEE